MTKDKDLLNVIIDSLHEKKGNNIVSLDFQKFDNSICKYFVICDGDSNTHVKALADSVEEFTYNKTGTKVWKREGFENSEWIILDYSDIVVHIFQRRFRDYYKIEDLWADADSKTHTFTIQ